MSPDAPIFRVDTSGTVVKGALDFHIRPKPKPSDKHIAFLEVIRNKSINITEHFVPRNNKCHVIYFAT